MLMRVRRSGLWIWLVWLIVVFAAGASAPAQEQYNGNSSDIVLQGFHWDSHAGALDPQAGTKKTWLTIIKENAEPIKDAGFTWVWFPPPSDSFAPQGYMPRRWNVMDTHYGTLCQLIEAIRSLGPVRAMADVVVNHRVGVATGGYDFADPVFHDNAKAVVSNDDSGSGAGAQDSGDETNFGRDLDHSNASVQEEVKRYLDKLRFLGFSGWRYDVAKGYAGKYTTLYNDDSRPLLSVGEYWDARQPILDWIDSTGGIWQDGQFTKQPGGKSAAFDFPTRQLLYDAINNDNYTALKTTSNNRAVPAGLIGFWPAMAVTFVDNHDTEWRRDQEHVNNNTIRHFSGDNVAMAYAYLMTHPGLPCVFWSHFFDWGEPTHDRIVQLMQVRRQHGLNSRSTAQIFEARAGLYAAIIDNKVAMKLGSASWSPGNGWHHPAAVDGHHFAVWVRSP